MVTGIEKINAFNKLKNNFGTQKPLSIINFNITVIINIFFSTKHHNNYNVDLSHTGQIMHSAIPNLLSTESYRKE
jgi:hypothetical protein